MNITVIDPIGKALERTKLVLFQPFDLGKWLTLGFCVWLATLVEGSGGGGSGGGGGGSDEWSEDVLDGRVPGGDGLERVGEWVTDNSEILIGIGSAVLFVAIAVMVLLSWLGSRGRFMFLDGVVRNRGAVVEPWNAFAELANSLFRFQLILTLVGFASFVVSAAVGVAIAWTDIEAKDFGELAIIGIGVSVTLFVILGFAWSLVNLFTRDFVVPAMYSRNLYVSDAWDVVRNEVLGEHAGAVALYVLMKGLLTIAFGVIIFTVVLASCCILALPLMIPYIGTVLMLPMFVFMRSYSLYFIEQIGDSWHLIDDEEAEPNEPAYE